MFSSPNQVAVDSTNDRLFVSQSPKELFVLEASTLEKIGNQPLVTQDRNEAIYALLPAVVTNFGVYSTGSTSRLFIMGAFVNDAGATVFNRIRVLDFNGVSFSEADFSPIELSDEDDTTDETDNSFADLLIDQANGVVYITDATTGLLYAMSVTDGSVVTGPLAITGRLQGMSLDSDRLYVCNSSTTESEQIINVVNVSDDSTTGIDIDAPCSTLAVQSNDSGTVLMARQSNDQKVFLRLVNTVTYSASSTIDSSSNSYADGVLTSGAGISSSIGDMVLSRASDGVIYAYLSELDGNIQFITFASDLSSYTLETLSTSVTNINHGALLKDSSGDASDAFMAAETGAILMIDVGTTSINVDG